MWHADLVCAEMGEETACSHIRLAILAELLRGGLSGSFVSQVFAGTGFLVGGRAGCCGEWWPFSEKVRDGRKVQFSPPLPSPACLLLGMVAPVGQRRALG